MSQFDIRYNSGRQRLPQNIDPKDYAIKQITKEFDKKNVHDPALPDPNSFYGGSDQYIILDSFRKEPTTSNLSRGIFSWNLFVQGATQDQFLGVRDKLDNIVEMQIGSFTYGDFPLVVLNEYPSYTTHSANSSFNAYLNGPSISPYQNNILIVNNLVNLSGIHYNAASPSLLYDIGRVGGTAGTISISGDTTITAIDYTALLNSTVLVTDLLAAIVTYTTTPTNINYIALTVQLSTYKTVFDTAITNFAGATLAVNRPGGANYIAFTGEYALFNTIYANITYSYTLNSALQILPNSNILVELKESGLQAINDYNGKRHHFELNVEYDTIAPALNLLYTSTILFTGETGGVQTINNSSQYQYLNFYPDHRWDIYRFTDPLKSLDHLTLNIRLPNSDLTFNQDVYYNVPATYIPFVTGLNNGFVIGLNNGIVVGPNDYTVNLSTYYLSIAMLNNNLAAGDRIVITNYNPNMYPIPYGATNMQILIAAPDLTGIAQFVTPATGLQVGYYFNSLVPVNGVGILNNNAIMTNPLIETGFGTNTNNTTFNGVTPPIGGYSYAYSYVYNSVTNTIYVTQAQAVTNATCYVNVYILKRQLRIPMRFRRVIDRNTNYRDGLS